MLICEYTKLMLGEITMYNSVLYYQNRINLLTSKDVVANDKIIKKLKRKIRNLNKMKNN